MRATPGLRRTALAASLLLPTTARTQAAPAVCPSLWDYTEQMPTFAGGNVALISFLESRIIYPEAARRRKIEGNVYLQFTIDTAGQVQSPTVQKGLGYGCNDEAVRVVKLLRFTPGRHNGQLVCVRYFVPVPFKLK